MWRWKEPGRRGRVSLSFATRDEAIRSALHTALVTRGAPARDIPAAAIPGLWRSMEARGWRVEEVET